MTEQEFLARVSARLGRKSVAEAGTPKWAPSLPLPNVGPTDAEALAERFTLEAIKLSAKVYRVGSEAEVAAKVAEIASEVGAKGSAVRWEDPTLAGLGIDEALKGIGLEVIPFKAGIHGRELVEIAERSMIGVTGVDAAIAELGSLVMGCSILGDKNAPGRGRSVSLLPPVHIAIVRKEQIVYSNVAVFRRLAAGPMPSQVIFASGPSRSADIENDLSIGVHGPCQVHVIIV